MFFHRLCPAVIALDIQSSFDISGTLLGVLGSAYFYAYAIMQLPTGLMADSWGPRKTVSAFFVLAGMGSILMGVAPNLATAILGRVLVGLGVSTVFVCNFKLLSEWFSARQFVIMGGAFMAMGGIGALSSSAPLAWVSNVMGWRMTLAAVGIVTLLMAALVYALVRNRPSEIGLPPIRLDRKEVQTEMSLLKGITMVVTSGRFWPIAIWAFCVIGIGFAIGGLWGGPYLMQVYGLSKAAAGGVLSTFAMALIFGSPLLSWLANRFGRKPVLIGCSLVLMAVCGLLSWFVNSLTLPTLYILFFGLFLSSGPVGTIIAAVSKELFPITMSGTSVGTVNLFPFIGAAVFQVIIGAVLTSGSPGQTGYALVNFRYMFLICLAGAALSLAVAFLLKETLSVTKSIES
ncbi:MAG: MFS transporter [Desulfobacterales bacterium]|nr:MAG: MFS transporter [Desulfobacterales bacterium]